MSALGVTRDEVWRAMIQGPFGTGDVTLFDTTGYRSPKAAQIPAYGPDPGFSHKEWRRLSPSDQTAIVSSREALADSGVLDGGIDRTRVGVLLGSGTADLMRNEEWFAQTERVGIRRGRPSGPLDHLRTMPR